MPTITQAAAQAAADAVTAARAVVPPGAEVAAAVGLLGRLLYHADQVRRGRRPLLGVVVVCESLMAIPMGFIGLGLADWLGLADNPRFAFGILVAYVGPRGVSAALSSYLSRREAAGGAA